MLARRGRGSYLGDRSLGHVDAGATSMAALFETLSATVRHP
jgi:dihydroxyacetone kinase-like protein